VKKERLCVQIAMKLSNLIKKINMMMYAKKLLLDVRIANQLMFYEKIYLVIKKINAKNFLSIVINASKT